MRAQYLTSRTRFVRLLVSYGPVLKRSPFALQAGVSKVIEVRDGEEELTKEAIDAKLKTL